jgi:predicted pyridoxine 5'-phosphate oxidase superfamily flavin-nucleotide-binding protein
MSEPGWPEGSPYHEGEKLVQERAGTRELAEKVGRKVIRDFLPEQHREFYPQLPFVLLGGRDASGAVWASLRAGPPGFAHALDPKTLRIDAPALPGDPLPVTDGVSLGILGMQLETRRRNRANGLAREVGPAGFSLAVQQSFGNCPKYLWTRTQQPSPPEGRPTAHTEGAHLSPAALAAVRQADTLFIATAISEGADVSHRGGRPGFVHAQEQDSTVLTLPDFSGNGAFNTFGNLAVDPRAGLLFVDFETGGVLMLTGRAEVIWEGPELAGFLGAERLLRFHVVRGVHLQDVLPFRWTALEPAPQLARTGVW